MSCRQKNSELEDQLSELQKMLDFTLNVRITRVKWIGDFSPWIGLTIATHVNVTIQNNSTNSINELTLTTKLVYKDSGDDVGGAEVKQISSLGVGETREIRTRVLYPLPLNFSGVVGVATLRLDNATLDEWRHNF